MTKYNKNGKGSFPGNGLLSSIASNNSRLLIIRDHSKFKKYSGNREINKVHERSLMQSLLTKGQLLPIVCNKINGYYYILDGQHRQSACHKLGLDVVVLLNPIGVTKKRDIISMNTLSKKWTLHDYCRFYSFRAATPHFESYQLAERLADAHKNVGLSHVCYLLSRTADLSGGTDPKRGKKGTPFKEGRFEARMNETEADYVLKAINKTIKDMKNTPSIKPFVNGRLIKAMIRVSMHFESLLDFDWNWSHMKKVCNHPLKARRYLENVGNQEHADNAIIKLYNCQNRGKKLPVLSRLYK